MKEWFLAYFSVPFSPKKAWQRTNLHRREDFNWDITLMLLFLSIGGFFGANFILARISYSGLIYDPWSWMLMFYFAQIIRFMLVASVVKGAAKENGTSMAFNKRLAILLICLGIPTLGHILISHFSGSFMLMHIIRGGFLAWAYVVLFHSLKYFTSVEETKIRATVVLVAVFDFIVVPMITYFFNLIVNPFIFGY